MRNEEEPVAEFFSRNAQGWKERYDLETFDAYNYKERARIATRWLFEALPRGGGRLLEMGCGAGVQARAIQGIGWSVTGADISLDMVRTGAAGGTPPNWLVCNTSALPFAACSFDAVVLLGVIGYIPRPAAALRKLRTVLKPDGILVISWYSPPPYLLSAVSDALSLPIQKVYELFRRLSRRPLQEKWTEHNFYQTHNRPWHPIEFQNYLREAGFDVRKIRSVNFGRIRVAEKALWGEKGDIRASRALEVATARLNLNRLRGLARTHVALAHPKVGTNFTPVT